MKISHEFIHYEQALELKELGFDEDVIAYWEKNSLLKPIPMSDFINSFPVNDYPKADWIAAPLYQQAFRWFREKYSINSWIINAEDNNNAFKPFFRGNNIDEHLVDFYNTYEEAELARLKKLIEIAKNK
jgi:hypothetical protein